MKIIDMNLVKAYKNECVLIEYTLDEKISLELIEFLGKTGIKEFFPDFARPFFRITREKCYVIKGILENTSFQVFFLISPEVYEKEICEYIELFRPEF